MVQKKPRTKKTIAERREDAVKAALAQGFKPLTRESMAALAFATEKEAQDLLEVSADLRRRSRARARARRSSS